MKRDRSLFALMLFCLSYVALGQGFYDHPLEVDANGFVKDHYIIAFHPRREGETPVVWPPNPANHPPFPLHSSGQDAADIEAVLNLNGDVLAIHDVLNSVSVRMSAREAERLRADPRVLYIEQSQMLTADGSGTSPPPPALYVPGVAPFSNGPELYQGDRYTLSLPSVDYNGIPGKYQDATIEYSPQKQSWRLYDYQEAVPIAEIDSVALTYTVEKPTQVFLRISGKFGNDCPQVGDIGMRQHGPGFIVYLYYRQGSNAPGRVCTGAEVPFSRTVALPVYGLVAGTYTYSVNGNFSGSFTLSADNVLE